MKPQTICVKDPFLCFLFLLTVTFHQGPGTEDREEAAFQPSVDKSSFVVVLVSRRSIVLVLTVCRLED